MVAFALLALALFGYGALPSNPPPKLSLSTLHTLMGADFAPQRFVLPEQVEEHRNRASLDKSDGDGVDHAGLLPKADPEFAETVSCAQGPIGIDPAPVAACRNPNAPRAPPLA